MLVAGLVAFFEIGRRVVCFVAAQARTGLGSYRFLNSFRCALRPFPIVAELARAFSLEQLDELGALAAATPSGVTIHRTTPRVQ